MNVQFKRIAKAARAEMEDFARQYDIGGDPKDLNSYCAISSYFLSILARRLGFAAILVEGIAFDYEMASFIDEDGDNPDLDCNHCWVEYDGWIYDITATQFKRLQKVHTVAVDSKKGRATYYGHNKHNDARRSLKRKWTDNQTPYSYLPELRRRVNKLATQLAA